MNTTPPLIDALVVHLRTFQTYTAAKELMMELETGNMENLYFEARRPALKVGEQCVSETSDNANTATDSARAKQSSTSPTTYLFIRSRQHPELWILLDPEDAARLSSYGPQVFTNQRVDGLTDPVVTDLGKQVSTWLVKNPG